MDLTDPQCFATRLEASSQRQQNQRDRHEAEQTSNDVVRVPTGGEGESQRTQAAGSHLGREKRTPPGPFS